MQFDNLFYELLNKAPGVKTRATGDAFLAHIKELYGLSSVAYLGLNIPSAEGGRYFQNTYSNEWRIHYISNDFISIDPVVRRGLLSLLPQEWHELEAMHPAGRRVFDEAAAFGIRRLGLTFPIRGVHNETAVFSIGADLQPRDWAHVKMLCLRDLQVLANYFHQTVMERHGHDLLHGEPLSEHEIECLKWSAKGKSAWETSAILKRSERTIKFHLNTARYKLNSVTTTQAVAKAIARGIVSVS